MQSWSVRGTAALDDPLLTARPPGPRVATRIVIDSKAALALDSQLVRTVGEAPLLVASGPGAPWKTAAPTRRARRGSLTVALRAAERPFERGAVRRQPGSCSKSWAAATGPTFSWRAGRHSWAHSSTSDRSTSFTFFSLPGILGGERSLGAVGGSGLAAVNLAAELRTVSVEQLDGDVYINARRRPGSSPAD